MVARLASLRGFPRVTGSGLIPVRPLNRLQLRSWTKRRLFCVLPNESSSVSFDLDETELPKPTITESTEELEIEFLQSSDSEDDEVIEYDHL